MDIIIIYLFYINCLFFRKVGGIWIRVVYILGLCMVVIIDIRKYVGRCSFEKFVFWYLWYECEVCV